jgi:predicted TPR repeat methyltransferase
LVSKGFVEAEYESGEAGAEGMRLDREGQAEAFDAIGDRYDEAFPYKKGQLAAAEWLIRSLAGGSRVLDLGCGTGLPTARQLVDAGFEVVGIDLSRRMVELAREYVPHDLRRFDAVAAFFSLLMLPRGEIPVVLRRVHDLLVPGGLFALSMVEADVDYFAIPFLGHAIRVSGYLRDDLREVVEQAGFAVVEESSYTYAPEISDVPPEEQIFLNCVRRG